MSTFFIRKITDGESEALFTFECDTRNYSHGFVHRCDLRGVDFHGGLISAHNKCTYYNRTWEEWDYQSVCIVAVRGLIEEAKNNLLDSFKSERGYERMTAKRRDEFDSWMDSGIESGDFEWLRVLIALKESLRGYKLKYNDATVSIDYKYERD